MVAALLDLPFVSPCIGLEVNGEKANVLREIDGGKEKSVISLPVVIGGKKGLVEEKDLRIPNMRGIMTARTKPLEVRESAQSDIRTKAVKYEKPAPKSAVKMVDSADELVKLLHSEAKVI